MSEVHLVDLKKEFDNACFEVVKVEFTTADSKDEWQSMEHAVMSLPGFCSWFGVGSNNEGYYIITDDIDKLEDGLYELDCVESYTRCEAFQPNLISHITMNAPSGTDTAECGETIWLMDRSEAAEVVAKAIQEMLDD